MQSQGVKYLARAGSTGRDLTWFKQGCGRSNHWGLYGLIRVWTTGLDGWFCQKKNILLLLLLLLLVVLIYIYIGLTTILTRS